MVAGVGDVDVVRRINCDSLWPTELPVTSTAAAPAHDETSAGSKLFNSMVAEVRNVNIAGRINRDSASAVQELAIATACRAPRQLENAACIKFLNYAARSFGESVAYVNIARGPIDCDSGRGDDRSGSAAAGAKFKLEDTAGIEFLNAIVLIGNKNII